MQEEYNT